MKIVKKTDQELLQEYRQTGNQEFIALLYKRYMPQVLGTCIKYLRDRDVAQDAVMDLYIHLVKKLADHEVTNFKSWLYSTATNHCLMFLRKAKNNAETPLDERKLFQEIMEKPEFEHLENDSNIKETKLMNALESLSGDQKECIRLFYLEGKSYKDVATLTGNDEKAVKSHIQNGKRNLKISLGKTINS